MNKNKSQHDKIICELVHRNRRQSLKNLTTLGRLKRVTSRLSSSDIAQQPASAASARWLVVERYLKNLIEKSPASVCLESSNYSFPDLYLISLCRVTNKNKQLVCKIWLLY